MSTSLFSEFMSASQSEFAFRCSSESICPSRVCSTPSPGPGSHRFTCGAQPGVVTVNPWRLPDLKKNSYTLLNHTNAVNQSFPQSVSVGDSASESPRDFVVPIQSLSSFSTLSDLIPTKKASRAVLPVTGEKVPYSINLICYSASFIGLTLLGRL